MTGNRGVTRRGAGGLGSSARGCAGASLFPVVAGATLSPVASAARTDLLTQYYGTGQTSADNYLAMVKEEVPAG